MICMLPGQGRARLRVRVIGLGLGLDGLHVTCGRDLANVTRAEEAHACGLNKMGLMGDA